MPPKYSLSDLQLLAATEDIPDSLLPSRLARLSANDVPTFATAADEERRDEILAGHAKTQKSHPFLTKRRKQSFTFKTVTAVLPQAVEYESAGVVQAFLQYGGDARVVKNNETRQSQTAQRSRLLVTAVTARNLNTVWVLAPLASTAILNEALAAALAQPDVELVTKLLQYGADPNSCRSQLLTLDPPLLAIMLRAVTAVQNDTLISNLTIAVEKGCLQSLVMLCEAADLTHSQELEAIKAVIETGRRDMLLAILLHAPFIRGSFLDEFVLQVYESTSTPDATKRKMLEILLSAGACGDNSSAAMVLAVETRSPLLHLLIKHHVDVNWAEGRAVQRAVQFGNSTLVRQVLASGEVLPESASEAVKCVPRRTPDRFEILRLLLHAGATGPPLDQQLIIAVQNTEQTIIELLQDGGASLDRNTGQALIEAIKQEQVEVLQLLLHGSVLHQSLQAAFPFLRKASKGSRLLMTTLLLEAGAVGPAVDAALRDAVCDQDQDPRLVEVLVGAGADPSFDDCKSLRHAIASSDLGLLRALTVNIDNTSPVCSEAMTIEDAELRLQVLNLLVSNASPKSLSLALIVELQQIRPALQVVQLLAAHANVDYDNGKLLAMAANLDEPVFASVLAKSRQSMSFRNALISLLQARDVVDEQKAARTTMLLDNRHGKELAYIGLKTVVEAAGPSTAWPVKTMMVLLQTQPNVNTDEGYILAAIAQASHIPILRSILRLPLEEATIDRALIQAVRSPNPSETTSLMLEATPSLAGKTSAFELACCLHNPQRVCELLLEQGVDFIQNNHGAVRAASLCCDLLESILRLKPPPSVLEAAFEQATTEADQPKRYKKIGMILQAGLQGSIIDDYLISLVEAIPSDLQLIQLLLYHGAYVHAQDSRSLIVAATRRKLEVLQLLWASVTQDVSDKCFRACLAARLIEARELDIVRFLLEQGARDCRHEALLVVGHVDMASLLIAHGASVNHQEGLCLFRAAQAGRVDLVQVFAVVASYPNRARALYAVVQSTASTPDFCQMIDFLSPRFSDVQQQCYPAVRVLLERRPRAPEELKKILDAGCTVASSGPDLLHWAMTNKVKSRCIELLIDRGANVSYEHDGMTVVMLATQTGKTSLLRSILKHTDPSITDKHGRTPLLLAVEKGDSMATAELLAAGATPDDGSLHQAVRNLMPKVAKMLIEHGHSPMLPSSFVGHGRRTPLAELLTITVGPSQFHRIREIVDVLREGGADLKKSIGGKPLICVALDGSIGMAEAMLRAGLARTIDEEWNFYEDTYVYSPTMYCLKVLRDHQKATLLRQYGAEQDVYYALQGPQPEDAVGMPPSIAMAEEERRRRVREKQEFEETHQVELRRYEETAMQLERIRQQQHENQLRRNRETEADSIRAMVHRQEQEMSLAYRRSQAEKARREEERRFELDFERARNESLLTAARERSQLELEHRKLLLLQDQDAAETQLEQQKAIQQSMDLYAEREHERRMEEIAYEKAAPLDSPTLSHGSVRRGTQGMITEM